MVAFQDGGTFPAIARFLLQMTRQQESVPYRIAVLG
jgi:hypothetical protein